MSDETRFPCMQCGACCRHIDRIPSLADFDPGTGVCIHLHGNLCDIYDTRPLVCRVDAMYDNYFHSFYTREEYYQLNLKGCASLQTLPK